MTIRVSRIRCSHVLGLIVLLSTLFSGVARGQNSYAAVSAALNQSALKAGDLAVIAIVLDVKPGYHAQSHTPLSPDAIKTELTVDAPPAVAPADPIFPAGHMETYSALGTLSVYTGRTIIYVPMKIKPDAAPGPVQIKGTVTMQICDDKACFPPDDKPFSIDTRIVSAGETVTPNQPELFADYKPVTSTTATTKVAPSPNATTAPAAASLSSGPPPIAIGLPDSEHWSWAVALLMAFVAGVVFNIVPCVLPVLPIKILGFHEVAHHDRGKTMLLAGFFGVGIVTVFAVLSLFVVVLHSFAWGEQFSNPIFAWGVVILFALMAAWLFGWLNVGLPTGVYNFTPRHDTYVGNYQWGVLTAILSTPCTGPFFGPILLWAQAEPKSLGVLAMIIVGVGMAAPYVVLSAFPELVRRFPRTGPWPELFKQMMGFLLLGAAVFFAAGRFVTGGALWWTVVPVALLGAIYLMSRTVQLSKTARAVAISSVFAVLMLSVTTYVAADMSGMFAGAGAGHGAAAGNSAVVNWVPYSDDVVDSAHKSGRIVLVKFTANWCLNCQYVEATVYHDATAIDALNKHNVLTVKADLTKTTAPGWPRLKQLNPAGGIPLTAIYVPGYDQPITIDSVYTTDTLVKTLDQIGPAKVATVR